MDKLYKDKKYLYNLLFTLESNIFELLTWTTYNEDIQSDEVVQLLEDFEAIKKELIPKT